VRWLALALALYSLPAAAQWLIATPDARTEVGATFEHVVKLNNYIVDIGTNIAHYREVRDKYVNTAAPPASTTIGVPQLARPGALFEVEAIAVLPAK